MMTVGLRLVRISCFDGENDNKQRDAETSLDYKSTGIDGILSLFFPSAKEQVTVLGIGAFPRRIVR